MYSIDYCRQSTVLHDMMRWRMTDESAHEKTTEAGDSTKRRNAWLSRWPVFLDPVVGQGGSTAAEYQRRRRRRGRRGCGVRQRRLPKPVEAFLTKTLMGGGDGSFHRAQRSTEGIKL